MVQILSVATFPMYVGRKVPAQLASLLPGICFFAQQHWVSSCCVQPLQYIVLSQTAFKLNTKDITRWCMESNTAPTLQMFTFLWQTNWVHFGIGHKNFLHFPILFSPFLTAHTPPTPTPPQTFCRYQAETSTKPLRKNTTWQEVEKMCETHVVLKPSIWGKPFPNMSNQDLTV